MATRVLGRSSPDMHASCSLPLPPSCQTPPLEPLFFLLLTLSAQLYCIRAFADFHSTMRMPCTLQEFTGQDMAVTLYHPELHHSCSLPFSRLPHAALCYTITSNMDIFNGSISTALSIFTFCLSFCWFRELNSPHVALWLVNFRLFQGIMRKEL